MSEFKRRMEIRAREVVAGANRVKRAAALAIDSHVVLSTPVDTGRARANWIVELDAVTGQMMPVPASPQQGAQAAIDAGASVIAQAQPGDEIVISNSLPYIRRLNEGWSAQAPAHFVERSVLDGVEVVRRARIFEGGL